MFFQPNICHEADFIYMNVSESINAIFIKDGILDRHYCVYNDTMAINIKTRLTVRIHSHIVQKEKKNIISLQPLFYW